MPADLNGVQDGRREQREKRIRESGVGKRLRFTKMHGLGNDFMVVDAIHQEVRLSPEQIRKLSDRRFGIGFDQLLLVEPPPSAEVDFGYRIFNADGAEVAQCGNGARCLARFVREKGLISRDRIRVATSDRTMVLELVSRDRVKVEMGRPRFEPEAIPLAFTLPAGEYRLELGTDRLLHFGAVSLGNPHAVVWTSELDRAPVVPIGEALNHHPLFPEGVNVGFVEWRSPDQIRLRVYERGVGETFACGSGACAAVAVGIDRGWLARRCRVDLPGGSLEVVWPSSDSPIVLVGPAASVFEGEIDLEHL